MRREVENKLQEVVRVIYPGPLGRVRLRANRAHAARLPRHGIRIAET